MVKRELYIIAGFAIVGVLAYQMTASTPAGRGRRFSLSGLVDSARREVRGNRATASFSSTGHIPVGSGIRTVRIADVSGTTVLGEEREDISYELTVEANGPDGAAARQAAGRTTIVHETLGPVLSLRASSPRDVQQTARLTVRLPARLAVRVEGASNATAVSVTQVAGVQLDAVVGDVALSEIAGRVTGSHRNGQLTVSDANGVTMMLASSQATFTRTEGPVTLGVRNGRCHIVDAQALVEIDAANDDITVVRPSGPVHISGTDGGVAIEDPRNDVRVDVRNTGVHVTLTQPVHATILTTNAPLRLTLTGPPAISLDAMTTGGTVTAADFSLTADASDRDSRLVHTFGDGRAMVALRNQRGPIEINLSK